jgi:pheromone shutdown protein TraB
LNYEYWSISQKQHPQWLELKVTRTRLILASSQSYSRAPFDIPRIHGPEDLVLIDWIRGDKLTVVAAMKDNGRTRVISGRLATLLSVVGLLSIRIANGFSGISSSLLSYRRIVPTTATTTRLFFASTERSCIELIDPETGCEIVLLGCFHGSPSSANDVVREVTCESTDVIVLELCASRFADLRRSMYNNKAVEGMDATASNRRRKQPPTRTPGLIRFLQVVADTIRNKGLSTGIATGILGGVSGLQTALSGFTPGLEFYKSLELAQSNTTDCDIILADQEVDLTLEKVGKLPTVILSMMKEIVLSASPAPSSTPMMTLEQTQWGKMSQALQTALFGNPKCHEYQVNVGRVMTRNTAVLLEMTRLLVPPIVITQSALTIMNQLLFSSGESMITTSTDHHGIGVLLPMIPVAFINKIDPLLACALDVLPHAAVLTFMLSCAYAFLAVPVTQVILSERDDQLTRGILAACRLAASKQKTKGENAGRVVAVLGLLHINGVAQRVLLADYPNDDNDAVVVAAKSAVESKTKR